MKTVCEVKTGLARLVQQEIATSQSTKFVESCSNDGKLIVGVTGDDGLLRRFSISVEEHTEAPQHSTPQTQSQEGTGDNETQPKDGCCHGNSACGEAKTASPAQDEAKTECCATTPEAPATEAAGS